MYFLYQWRLEQLIKSILGIPIILGTLSDPLVRVIDANDTTLVQDDDSGTGFGQSLNTLRLHLELYMRQELSVQTNRHLSN